MRIAGLKAQPTLNGELGQVLNAAKDGPERLVVRTRMGDKSLKPANLLVGRPVLPKGVVQIWITVTVLSALVVADVLRSSGRSSYSAAAAPALCALWVVMTCGLGLCLSWPCREPGSWMLSVSELSTNTPSREFFRLGFLSAGALFAITIWLYSQLVVVQLAPTPPMPPPAFSAGANTTLTNDSGNATLVINDTEVMARTEDSNETGDDSENLNDTAVDDTNKTVLQNTTSAIYNSTVLESAPERSINWGYVAAVGLAVQGVFVYDGRLSWRSWIHFAGFIAFGVGLFQNCTLTSLVIASPRGKPLLEASSLLTSVVKARRYITDYVPLLLLAAPLSSQLFNSGKMRHSYGQPTTFKSVFKDSGMLMSACVFQWISLLVFSIFYSTFACEFWVGAQLLAA